MQTLVYLERVLAQAPNDLEALTLKAQYYFQIGEPTLAFQCLTQAAQINPQQQGGMPQDRLTMAAMEEQVTQIPAFKRGLVSPHYTTQTYFYQSLVYLRQGRYKDAQILAQEIQGQPGHACIGSYLMALVKLSAGNYAAAQTALQPVASVPWQKILRTALLAHIASLREQPLQVHRILKAGLVAEPTAEILYQKLAAHYVLQQRPDRAAEVLSQGMARVKPAWGLVTLWIQHHLETDPKASRDLLLDAPAAWRSQDDYHYWQAEIALALGDSKQAVMHFNNYSTQPTAREQYRLRLQAAIATAQGDWAQARLAAQQLLRQAPSESDALRLAKQYWQQGETALAVSLLTDYLAGHSDAMNAQLTLAGYYRLLNDPINAARIYRQMLAQDPAHAIAKQQLTTLLSGLKRQVS